MSLPWTVADQETQRRSYSRTESRSQITDAVLLKHTGDR
jgi:hypothetical protein